MVVGADDQRTAGADPRRDGVEDRRRGLRRRRRRAGGLARDAAAGRAARAHARRRAAGGRRARAARAESEAEGLHAIAELAAGRPADPDALLAAAEVDADRMLAATAAGLMAKDAEAHVDAGNFVRPAWDGRSQLICGFGDKFLLQGETLSLDGTAFLAMYGCQLHLVDCDITADTIVQVMMRAEVTITGGTMRPRDTFVRQLRGSLVVAGVEVASRPRVGIDVLGGTAHVADLTVSADTGVRAGADAKVELVGGRIEGATQAIESGGTAVVSHDGTRVIGPITIGRGSSVAAVSAPVATAPPVPR
ncbi:MAG: hypothetical protein IPN32_31705 [Deltaproteobacteria bacterium]|nr:hypothetical protein [Deltaproteobacteria bacterium]